MMETRLEIKNTSFAYGKKEIFRDISFFVEAGEILCLLGPNGTGKTTLFKSIIGLLKPKNGQVLMNHENIGTWSCQEIAKKIGYVPQNHTPPFPFSVFDVILMGRTAHLRRYSMPTKIDIEIAEKAIETLDITHLKDRIYTEISGGERQLVLIARALAQEPEVLIMDEPTANLDFGNQIKVYNHIKKLADSGLAVIMSSHFPNHAFLYASKVALMKDGNIIALGNPQEIITEKNLKTIYEVDLKIAQVAMQENESMNICIPAH